jgi:cation transport regulator ChaB
MNQIFTPDELIQFVDTLAEIRAQIADLKSREDIYKAALIAAGHPAIDGTEHRAAVIQEQRTTTDWEAIATKLNASRQLITAHTKTGEPFYKIRLSARKVSK